VPERRALAVVLVVLVLGPLGLRGVSWLLPQSRSQASYLPSLESSRPRLPFRGEVIEQLKYQNPTYVFVGDSMLWTRIDPQYLGDLAGNEQVAFLQHAGTGPAWWYLAIKNYLIPSQTKPRVVFIFFRDTNLTDTLFRATGNFRWALDEVAREHEATLDRIIASRLSGAWHRVVAAINGAYAVDRIVQVSDVLVRQLPMRAVVAPEALEDFEHQLNEFFSIDALRPFTQADIDEDADRMDFAGDLGTSVLPEMFRLARVAGYRLCFVRVQRRPLGRKPPAQSPALRHYLEDLETYLRANGAEYYDEYGDPDYPETVYADGDHIRSEFRTRYTELFRQKLDPLFR
jgi:hypothetical protein